jgi:hypothetical protein
LYWNSKLYETFPQKPKYLDVFLCFYNCFVSGILHFCHEIQKMHQLLLQIWPKNAIRIVHQCAQLVDKIYFVCIHTKFLTYNSMFKIIFIASLVKSITVDFVCNFKKSKINFETPAYCSENKISKENQFYYQWTSHRSKQ